MTLAVAPKSVVCQNGGARKTRAMKIPRTHFQTVCRNSFLGEARS